ncbi:conserved protein of unknown function [Sterolibacterium denitrificans]|uniref:Uncharacterized protein n=1 Tax=Sterolibacterium denitrificans TaxID=157592 RepID=A0A7Z7MV58_9PROT|nr:hypothetical protein [Sterolibacterium denitrificans]SMB26050.1 conserved protein of unknown function [Sterolibacterium denitrificans]
MAGGSWSCPHEVDGLCSKVNHLPCDPGMKGCVLAGRYFFFSDDKKNERLRTKRAREAVQAGDEGADEALSPAHARQGDEHE